MFTQSCFIHKNSKKLLDKLGVLGYTTKDYVKGGNGIQVDIDVDPPIAYSINYSKKSAFLCEGVNCEENEDIFFAIAALRDDSDYKQWFVDDETMYDKYTGELLSNKGDWNLYLEEQWIEYDSPRELRHKATVEEILEHFKN